MEDEDEDRDYIHEDKLIPLIDNYMSDQIRCLYISEKNVYINIYGQEIDTCSIYHGINSRIHNFIDNANKELTSDWIKYFIYDNPQNSFWTGKVSNNYIGCYNGNKK